MSAYVKGMVMRSSSTHHVYTQRLLKEKFGDQFDLIRAHGPSLGVSQWSSRVRLSRCQQQQEDSHINAPLMSPSPKRREPPLRGPTLSQAILTPISDPTKVAKKVRYIHYTIQYTILVCTLSFFLLLKNVYLFRFKI